MRDYEEDDSLFLPSGSSDGKYKSARSEVQRRSILRRARDPRLNTTSEDSIYSDISEINRRSKRLLDDEDEDNDDTDKDDSFYKLCYDVETYCHSPSSKVTKTSGLQVILINLIEIITATKEEKKRSIILSLVLSEHDSNYFTNLPNIVFNIVKGNTKFSFVGFGRTMLIVILFQLPDRVLQLVTLIQPGPLDLKLAEQEQEDLEVLSPVESLCNIMTFYRTLHMPTGNTNGQYSCSNMPIVTV